MATCLEGLYENCILSMCCFPLRLTPAGQLTAWFKDYFFKSFTRALQLPSAVETTKVRACSLRGRAGERMTLGAVCQATFGIPHKPMPVRPCSLQVGMLDSALSHLAPGAGSKKDFVAALARGLGANMDAAPRSDFINDLAR